MAQAPAAAAAGGAPKSFVERFAADSAEAGLARTLSETQQRAAGLCGEGRFEEALEAFEEAAHAAVELGDRAAEASAVIGMAECLSKPAEVDDELVSGMYRHAEVAAADAGDAALRFRALAGRASLKRALRRFDESEAVWEAALSLAREQDSAEQTSFALTQLGLTLLQDPLESTVDVVNDSKQSAGHLDRSGDASAGAPSVQLRTGPSQRASRAAKLLAEAVEKLPAAASVTQQAVAHMNLVAALRRQGGTKSKRKVEQEMVAAYDLLKDVSTGAELRKSVAALLLEHYEENAWLADGRPEAQERLAALRAQEEEAGAKKPELQASKRQDPQERYAFERALWAKQKLREMEAAAEDSDSGDDGGPVCPPGTGWQRDADAA